jgi:recombinational DNA repair protein (RecF pathway)
MAGGGTRVTQVPAFVLHAYPFRETSLIVEAFTGQFGRIAWVARGARRAGSAMRGLLLPFQPMAASWGGVRAQGQCAEGRAACVRAGRARASSVRARGALPLA